MHVSFHRNFNQTYSLSAEQTVTAFLRAGQNARYVFNNSEIQVLLYILSLFLLLVGWMLQDEVVTSVYLLQHTHIVFAGVHIELIHQILLVACKKEEQYFFRRWHAFTFVMWAIKHRVFRSLPPLCVQCDRNANFTYQSRTKTNKCAVQTESVLSNNNHVLMFVFTQNVIIILDSLVVFCKALLHRPSDHLRLRKLWYVFLCVREKNKLRLFQVQISTKVSYKIGRRKKS